MSHYRRALRLSILSTYPVPNKRMGAVVVSGGRVLSTAVNIARTHHAPWTPGKHAEIRALRPHQQYAGATLYVARRNGLASRPCEDCMRAIRAAGVSRVVYAGADGRLITERVSSDYFLDT